MRTIIAGSRENVTYENVTDAVISCGFNPTVIISGTARGADQLGERFAKEHGIPVEQFPADWNKYGKSAGYRRNEQMAEHAEALVAVWDGVSRGTMHMIEIAKRKGLVVHVFRVQP